MALFSMNASDQPGNGPEGPSADALLDLMVKRSLFSLELRVGQPLPGPGGGAPTPLTALVINRLKVMARLNPVVYKEPVEGTIERPRSGLRLVYTLRFDDRASPPSCLIKLQVKGA